MNVVVSIHDLIPAPEDAVRMLREAG